MIYKSGHWIFLKEMPPIYWANMEWSQFFVCMSLHLNGTWQCNVIILKWTFFQACNSITFWQHYTLYWTGGVLPHSTVFCHQFAFVTMEPSQQDNWKRKSALFFSNFLNSLDAAEVSKKSKTILDVFQKASHANFEKLRFCLLWQPKQNTLSKTHTVVP